MLGAMYSERTITAPDGRSLRTAVTGPDDGLAVLWNGGNPSAFLSPIDEETATRESVRVVTYDRPGYGRSTPKPGRRVVDSAADAEVVLDAWDVDACASVGISGGGAHALASAALLPGRVLCVAVLCGAAPIDAEGLDFTDGLTATNVAVTTEHGDLDRATEMEEMEPERQRILADPRSALQRYAAEMPEADREVLRTQPEIETYVAEGMREALVVSSEGWLDDSFAYAEPWGFDPASISVPVSVWHGRDDTASPIAHGRWLARSIDAAELRVLEGGHYAPLVALPEVWAWLRARSIGGNTPSPRWARQDSNLRHEG
jgi:pimeloyl-ACP methyl ester carboxylesterase